MQCLVFLRQEDIAHSQDISCCVLVQSFFLWVLVDDTVLAFFGVHGLYMSRVQVPRCHAFEIVMRHADQGLILIMISGILC